MLLELGKAASFFLCILSLYPVLLGFFFEPDTPWQQRTLLGLARLAVAACLSLASGLLFCLPARSNPDAGIPLRRTLPVRLFLWTACVVVVLFLLSWYLRCGGLNSFGAKVDCYSSR